VDPGTPLANRADLRVAGQRPVPNQPYGEAARQAESLRVAPLASGELAGPHPAPERGGRPQPATPGTLPFLHETQRPGEPVTHGAMLGPGDGPMALDAAPTMSVAQQLHLLADGPDGSDTLARLANIADRQGL
jgi:hypothetical protein